MQDRVRSIILEQWSYFRPRRDGNRRLPAPWTADDKTTVNTSQRSCFDITCENPDSCGVVTAVKKVVGDVTSCPHAGAIVIADNVHSSVRKCMDFPALQCATIIAWTDEIVPRSASAIYL